MDTNTIKNELEAKAYAKITVSSFLRQHVILLLTKLSSLRNHNYSL